MMRRRTLIFLLLALLATPISVYLRHEEKIICPDTARLASPLLRHASSPQPRLLRVQAIEGDEHPEQPADPAPTPCQNSNISALLKISLAVSLGCWVGFVALLQSDYQQKKARARRARRKARTRYLQPGEELPRTPPPDNVEQ